MEWDMASHQHPKSFMWKSIVLTMMVSSSSSLQDLPRAIFMSLLNLLCRFDLSSLIWNHTIHMVHFVYIVLFFTCPYRPTLKTVLMSIFLWVVYRPEVWSHCSVSYHPMLALLSIEKLQLHYKNLSKSKSKSKRKRNWAQPQSLEKLLLQTNQIKTKFQAGWSKVNFASISPEAPQSQYTACY